MPTSIDLATFGLRWSLSQSGPGGIAPCISPLFRLTAVDTRGKVVEVAAEVPGSELVPSIALASRAFINQEVLLPSGTGAGAGVGSAEPVGASCATRKDLRKGDGAGSIGNPAAPLF